MNAHQDPLTRRWRRRLITIPLVFLAGLLALATLPVWVPVLAIVDALRGSRWTGLRCGFFLVAFAGCEAAGLAGAALILLGTVGRAEARQQGLYALQRWWSGQLFRLAQVIFQFTVEVEGSLPSTDRPVLVLARHRSMADTLLPSVVIANVQRLRLRYVIKRELLFDPCLDVVGQHLPNYFVDRNAEDGAAEVARVSDLAAGLGPGDGVLIFPEGTRFTPAKRARIIEKLKERGDDAGARQAEALQHVLLPKRGGPLALLAAAPEADVIFLAHSGFEAAGTFPSLWRGDLVGGRVRVRLELVPRENRPQTDAEREKWLYDEWARIDDWLGNLDGKV